MNEVLYSASKSLKSAKGSFSSVLKSLGVDTKLHFTLVPPNTESGYSQWLDAMKAVAKLPDGGMPQHFRKRLWITLADHYIDSSCINWRETLRMAFSERVTTEDDKLGSQIIKDLHRTGWSGLCGEEERVMLKRVLLAFARYNPKVGYCQGFNVIAALILEIVEYKEELALKVMILLIEKVLPKGYFDQTLQALTVDMAVLRELMHQKLPKLSAHLDKLQQNSESEYEPPLTNVFSMQWFLTLFATCLPSHAVLRVWDSITLEGSEILLRTALVIWSRIARRVASAKSTDEFYCLMGPISQELLMMSTRQTAELIDAIYDLAPFPFPGLEELRDRYTWNIQPLSSNLRLLRTQVTDILYNSDSDSEAGADSASYACITSFLMSPGGGRMCGSNDELPMKYGARRHVTDLSVLRKQYDHVRERQKQAAVILQNAYARGNQKQLFSPKPETLSQQFSQENQVFNHLYMGSSRKKHNVNLRMLNGIVPLASKPVQPGSASGSRKYSSGTKSSQSRRESVTTGTIMEESLSELGSETEWTMRTESSLALTPKLQRGHHGSPEDPLKRKGVLMTTTQGERKEEDNSTVTLEPGGGTETDVDKWGSFGSLPRAHHLRRGMDRWNHRSGGSSRGRRDARLFSQTEDLHRSQSLPAQLSEHRPIILLHKSYSCLEFSHMARHGSLRLKNRGRPVVRHATGSGHHHHQHRAQHLEQTTDNSGRDVAPKVVQRRQQKVNVSAGQFDLSLMPTSVKSDAYSKVLRGAKDWGIHDESNALAQVEAMTQYERGKSALICKSKRILRAAALDPHGGMKKGSRREMSANFNPFPVKHQTKLIEREKKMGLLSS